MNNVADSLTRQIQEEMGGEEPILETADGAEIHLNDFLKSQQKTSNGVPYDDID
jgi:hypothetical protein